jgi:N-acetylglucosamine-6-phosphate deacetylase
LKSLSAKALFNLNIFDGENTTNGWAVIDGEVQALGFGDEYKNLEQEFTDAKGGFLSPKLLDTHIHGGNGHKNDDGAEEMQQVLDYHAGHGVGSTFLSLISAPVSQILELIDSAKTIKDSRFLGLHLEGPFISQEFKGAHDAEVLHAPTDNEMNEIIEHGKGIVRSITLAPELTPISQINALLDAGIMPCFGHSAAGYEPTKEFFKLGSKVMTHAFNGMSGIHHRAPGPIPAALEADAFTELIADGVHVEAAAARLLNPNRVILVTDAMVATGMPDGKYSLGSMAVEVRESIARTESGSIAGSTLLLKTAVQNYANWVNSPEAALRAAITNPAVAYGINPRTISQGETEWLLWDKELNLLEQSAN